MKYLHLVWASLFRRKTRTVLTVLSIVVAFILFGLLNALIVAFNRGVELAGVDRLVVQGKYSLTEVLPVSYADQIRGLPGVAAVTHAQWFGGVYQERRNFFPQFAVDPASYMEMYPEFEIAPAQLQQFLATRTGAIAGASLARRFGWKIGDRIPIQATIWTRADGATSWEFDLVGIFEGRDKTARSQEGMLLFQWDYLDEARQFARGTTGIYIVRAQDPEQAVAVAGAIDARFANSQNETRTGSEKAFNQNFIKQIGDIGFIVQVVLAAVFFTILLVTGNTMAQSVRERIPEIAVLKTLGFTDSRALALVLAEAMLLCLIGAALGLGLVSVLVPRVAAAMESFLPGLGLDARTWLLGGGLAVALGLATGLLPALKARRLRIVDALGGHA
ncbi:MAG TPA: ABC transporter permease [Xanthomonadaceae bacterium]|nr:ABC transporter permease [Xanthomonadaceae bacterium]